MQISWYASAFFLLRESRSAVVNVHFEARFCSCTRIPLLTILLSLIAESGASRKYPRVTRYYKVIVQDLQCFYLKFKFDVKLELLSKTRYKAILRVHKLELAG